MTFKATFLTAAISLLAAGTACPVLAQTIVPPPKPVGQAAPVVLGPEQTDSLRAEALAPAAPAAAPAAAQPAVAASEADAKDIIDIALPAAPRPAPQAELTPDAPKAVKANMPSPASKKVTAKKDDKAEKTEKGDSDRKEVQASVDPFGGLQVTPVSDSQLNRFVFPEPVEGVYFPEGAPLPECPENASDHDPCKPVFLNGRHVMLLQLRLGAKGPVQMMTHLYSGRFVTLNLMPSSGPGAVVRVDGSEDGASDARLAASRAQSAGATSENGASALESSVQLLSRIASGDIPAGFSPMDVLSNPVRYDLFDVIPMASWDNEAGLRAHLYRVVPHGDTPVVIGPSLFRYDGVKALALDKDTITRDAPASLFILEQVAKEAQ